MTIWQSISTWFEKNASHMQHLPFPDPNASLASIEPNVHYFRLWLCELFLTQSRNWFRDCYPSVSSQVQLKFANQDGITFTRVAAPPKNQLGPGVYRNYQLTELMPFNGGTLDLQTALLALRGDSSMLNAIKVLEGFSQLVTAPLGQVLAIANQVTTGLDQMFGGTDGQVHLGFHQSYVASGGGGANPLKPGYIAVIAATDAGNPPAELSVQDDQLFRNGTNLTGFDYMLFRIEGRAERDDWRLKNIAEPLDKALEALAEGDAKKADACQKAAITAALLSPDLVRADRRRVVEAINEELNVLQKQGGHGFARGQRRTLAQIVKSRARTVEAVAALPEITSAEAFA
jgi:hypothetical protein